MQKTVDAIEPIKTFVGQSALRGEPMALEPNRRIS